MKLLNFILIFFLTFPLIGQEVFYSESNLFSIDTQNPQVELSYPNGGEELIPGDSISVQWNAVDDNFGELPILLLISTEAGGSFDILTTALPNLGMAPLNMPQVNSAYCLLKIEAVDFFGNTAYDESDGFFSIGSDDEGEIIDTLLTAYSESNLFIIDTQAPQVGVIYPNGGEELNAGEGITYQWSAEDGNLGDTPISLALSTAAGGTFETFAQGLVNDGLEESALPDINSTYCLLQVAAIDLFGNTALDESDVFFSIGSEQDGEIVDTLLFAFSESDNFPIDTRDPEITILYPNGGEQLLDYAQTEIAWLAEDDNSAEGSLSAHIAFELGGWFLTAASDLENTGSAVVDLSVGGVVPERLWGMLKMTATDAFGNSGLDYSNDYFILGDPDGDMASEWLSEEDNMVLLDWSWQEDELIVFDAGALSILSDGDKLSILDLDGIVNSSCSGGTGEIELGYLYYSSELDDNPVGLKVDAGADYCAAGGERYPGYVVGNPIIFQATYDNGTVENLIPDMGEIVFGDTVVIISGFGGNGSLMRSNKTKTNALKTLSKPVTMSGFQNTLTSTWQDGRDFNDYNIYRSTNAPISRDCGGNCGTCSDGLTFNQTDCAADGNTWTDLSWEVDEEECICLIAEHTPQTWYFDNFSMTQETWCYHVWLMDEETKLVKTVDSCMGFEIMLGDVNQDGFVNVNDLVAFIGYMLGTVELSDGGLIAADFNGDGDINVLDVVQIVDYILTPH